MKEKKAAREAAEIEETKKQEKVCVCRCRIYDFACSAWKTKGRPENAHDLVSAYLTTYNVAQTHQLIFQTAAAHSLTTSRPPSLHRSHTHTCAPQVRRMTGAEVAQAKKDYEDRQMKKLADEKKREREADRVHKAKVKVRLLRKLFTLIVMFESVGRSRAQGQG
jgi:hypothetical protein